MSIAAEATDTAYRYATQLVLNARRRACHSMDTTSCVLCAIPKISLDRCDEDGGYEVLDVDSRDNSDWNLRQCAL